MENEKGNTKVIGIVIVVAVLAVVGYVLTRPSPPAPAGPAPKLILGAETSLLTAPVWVAENKGFFKEEGIEVTIKEFGSGRASFVAMLKREGVDICTVAPTPIMFNSFERQDFTILATFVYSYDDVKVIARKDKGIKEASDLKGKKVGTPAGTTGQFFLAAYLTHNGIESAAVEAVNIAPAALPSARSEGTVDAIVVWEPHAFNAGKSSGENAVRLPSSEVYKETFNFLAMKDFTRENPEALKRFLRAISRAITFIRKNKEEAQSLVAQRLKLDMKVMTVLWDDFVFDISLEQSLLVTLEDEARWAIKSKLTERTEVPNYLEFVHIDALKAIRPETVTVIH
ncbi:MAG: NrtA/SsuA/CpmA family ABC transporter substrate-binding protein [Planctomycetota bacterium]|nr:NrtA/SsuA/CpmA family ABC transporter substrate-binding protein [Planctomycetota bacterium]